MSHLSNPQPSIDFEVPNARRRRPSIRYTGYRIYGASDRPEGGTAGVGAVGSCRAVWQLIGPEATYQIAGENAPGGAIVWHCTCADYVFRGCDLQGYRCKHIRALVDHLGTAA